MKNCKFRLFRKTALLAICLLCFNVPVGAGVADVSGNFAVSADGAATYNIPIALPPGTGGEEPKLSLSYNSQSGNNLLGVGWSLSGLSVITRCPRTVAQDGTKGAVKFDKDDRFCMDGQRLILISGTYGADKAEYRTERDSYSKIISYGVAGSGPQWFKVQTNSGQVIEYGNTDDSGIEAQGKTSRRAWAANKISDTKGNYFTVSYVEDSANGEYYPKQIDYTGNAGAGIAPNASVKFIYEDRTDKSQTYLYGSLIQVSKRLKTIGSFLGSTPVSEYRVAYQIGAATSRSRISSIAECEMQSNTCKPALVPIMSEMPSSFGAATSLTTLKPHYLSDVNGDARADLVTIESNGLSVALANADGVSFGASSKWSDSFGYTQGFSDANTNPIFLLDADGDGLADVVGFANDGVYVALSNGVSFDPPTKWCGNFGVSTGYLNMDSHPRLFADINGDGRPDIVAFKDDGVYVSIGTGAAFNLPTRWIVDFGKATTIPYASDTANPRFIFDVNGDGLADVVGFANAGIYVALSTGTAFSPATLWSSGFTVNAGWTSQDIYPRTFADVNGDGLPDIVGFMNDGVYVSLNTGGGFLPATRWISDFGTATGTAYATQKGFPRYVTDVNGDGLADIVGFSANGIQVALSSGVSFKPSTQWVAGFGSAAGYSATDMRQLADVDGDGFPDVIAGKSGGISVARSARTLPPDMMTSLSPGLGSVININYKPLTNSSIYTRGFGAIYPVFDATSPIYVVSAANLPNGLGFGYVSMKYRYGSLKGSLNGRGFLGFGWQEVIDGESNVVVRTDYRQDWPYIGMPVRVAKFAQGSSVFLSVQTNTYACINPKSGSACSVAAGQTYFPYINKTIEASWDLDGVALPVATTSYTYDRYGNPTQISKSLDDGTTKTTTLTYTNDTTNWFLGRLTRSVVASTTGGTPAPASNGIFYFNQTISANTNNYNLKNAAIAAGWDQSALLIATVSINAGVTVGSTSTSTPAFSTGTGYLSSARLSLINNGSIIGRGGAGGSGITITATTWTGKGAEPGGTGLFAEIPIAVTNNGTIAGGGGGGGGGNGYKANVPWPTAGGSLVTAFAGSSGGGGGAGGGAGGPAGTASGQSLIVSGLAGTAGTTTTAGQGGGSASCWQYATLKANTGGAGGALGQAGQAGSSAFGAASIPGATQFGTGTTPHPGGRGGAAAVGSLNITWSTAGTLLGALR